MSELEEALRRLETKIRKGVTEGFVLHYSTIHDFICELERLNASPEIIVKEIKKLCLEVREGKLNIKI